MQDHEASYARVLVRVAEDAVVNNRIGQWIGFSIAILMALTAAAMASHVIL
jgi:hypothetical protein